MIKDEIIKELSERHIFFVNYILSLSYKEFMFSFEGHWAAGQQMDHIYRSITLLPLAFKIPLFITGPILGTVKRPTMCYEELVEQYQSRLSKGAQATRMYLPRMVPYSKRMRLAEKIIRKVSKINAAIDLLPEKELDQALLPHPILGKITLREMLYFTMYHVDHHCAVAKVYLEKV